MINSRLAGEQLTYTQLLPYINSTIDDINSRLHTCFPQLTRDDANRDYTAFPDRWQRTVVVVGAGAKWYQDDEEGIATAQAMVEEYHTNLFLMERDYGPLVPEEYRESNASGMLPFPPSGIEHEGINPNIRYIEVKGPKGTSVTAAEIRIKDGQRQLWLQYTDQDTPSVWALAGVLDRDPIAFQIDVAGNIIALLDDGSAYVVGNMTKIMDAAMRDTNPIVDLDFDGRYMWGILYDGSKKLLEEHYFPDNTNRLFCIQEGAPLPDNALSDDVCIIIGKDEF